MHKDIPDEQYDAAVQLVDGAPAAEEIGLAGGGDAVRGGDGVPAADETGATNRFQVTIWMKDRKKDNAYKLTWTAAHFSTWSTARASTERRRRNHLRVRHSFLFFPEFE